MIQSDGPVALGGVQDKVPSIVFSGYNGESQGTALADVLLGAQNPSGHLNFTWYKDDSQLPPMQDYDLTPGGTGGLDRTYQHVTGTPAHPFGYGLSYTTFAYSHVKASPSATANGQVSVSFDVTNTGTASGATVARLYAATPFTVPGVEMPRKRLTGFHKTAVLRPGATEHVTLRVKMADLGIWDATAMRSLVPSGTYRFEVGPDSATTAAAPSVRVTGSLRPHTSYVTVQPGAVAYKVGDTIDLTGKNPWIKDDTDHSRERRNLGVTADDVVEAVNSDQSFVDLKHASVTYRSTNPDVATVDAAGHVRIVGSGVTTLKATVDGVTGSTAITARYPFGVTASSTVEPGGTATATATFTNSGPAALHDVTMSLTVPSGWTAQATSPASFSAVAGGRTGSGDATAPIAIPFASLSGAYANVAISDDARPSEGDLDGEGLSLSAQALAAAGITPGATVTHGGLSYVWPDVAAGEPDNVVAGGRSFDFSGSGATLGFLGLANNDTASGTGLITYTDGTTQPYTIGFPDWWAGGGDQMITLPDISRGVSSGTNAMHVFAVTTGG